MLILNGFIRHLKFKIFIHKVLYIFTLVEHFPTKQGLRHCRQIVVPTLQPPRRAFSNKTRIKT